MPKDDKTAAGVVQPVESEENQLFRDLATMHLRMQQLWRKFVALEEQVAAFWRAPLPLISLVIEKRLKATHDLVAAWEKEMGKTHKLPSLENHLTKLQESKNKLAAYQARLVEVSKLDWVAYTSETRALLAEIESTHKEILLNHDAFLSLASTQGICRAEEDLEIGTAIHAIFKKIIDASCGFSKAA